jgi:dipeptidyl aminopeptidase/acylaminoacyl peptidase
MKPNKESGNFSQGINTKHILPTVFLLLFVLFIHGCQPEPTGTSEEIGLSFPTETNTPKPTGTSSPTPTPTLTPTSTPTPSPTVTLTPTLTPTPTQQGGGQGKLLTSHCEAGKSHRACLKSIYTMNLDGSDLQLLIEDTNPIGGFLFSPDGRYIAYRAGYIGTQKLKIANADGSQARVVMEKIDDDSPYFSWSPDSKMIAYVMRGDLYTYSLDDDHHTRLTDTEYVVERNPQWSPDGENIAFGDIRRNKHLYIINKDGGEIIQLPGTEGISPNLILWSPDSQKIAFNYGYIDLSDMTITFLSGGSHGVWNCSEGPQYCSSYSPSYWAQDSLTVYVIVEARCCERFPAYIAEIILSTLEERVFFEVHESMMERPDRISIRLSPDGKLALIGLSDVYDDRSELYLFSLESGHATRIEKGGIWIP